MNEILEKIRECVIVGKINASTPFPPDMKGMPGAYDYTKEAIESGISPADIMNRGLVSAMDEVGQRFAENKIFVPQMLLSAKAMNAAMELLKPYFNSGAVRRKGTVIIGTILGDLHDIGKNLCGMMIEGPVGRWSIWESTYRRTSLLLLCKNIRMQLLECLPC
ncbi:B12-binding domain-containing protein [Bacteroides salyersiae]|nr:B12-binding domain-containing protein [Bacteroides salyersiae]